MAYTFTIFNKEIPNKENLKIEFSPSEAEYMAIWQADPKTAPEQIKQLSNHIIFHELDTGDKFKFDYDKSKQCVLISESQQATESFQYFWRKYLQPAGIIMTPVKGGAKPNPPHRVQQTLDTTEKGQDKGLADLGFFG